MKTIYKHQRLYMKYILALLCLSAAYTADCQGLYDHSFRDLNSKNVHLKDFAGKKILFIILPVSATDSLADQLKSFVTMYGDKVQVIGVLSQEDGYSPDRKADVMAIYQNTGILITDVIRARKGNGQSPLMKWLTNKNENGHFDMDAKGPGQKFFVNEQGKLYAVLGQLSLSSPFINKIVNATEGGQQAVPAKGKIKP
jgi:glutathione peroxidase